MANVSRLSNHEVLPLGTTHGNATQGALPGSACRHSPALTALDASLPLVAFTLLDHPFIRLVLWSCLIA